MKDKDGKFLAEQMGLCWHEAEWKDAKWDKNCHHFFVVCRKCGLTLYTPDRSEKNPDFTTETDWTKLLLWAQDDSRHEGWTWDDFWWWGYNNPWERIETTTSIGGYARWLFTPSTFAGVLYEFLKERGRK